MWPGCFFWEDARVCGTKAPGSGPSQHSHNLGEQVQGAGGGGRGHRAPLCVPSLTRPTLRSTAEAERGALGRFSAPCCPLLGRGRGDGVLG